MEPILAQITVADVRAMLRADALALVLGTALGAISLLTLGLSAVVRRRAAGAPWLGLFALLYGMRLLIRTDTFPAALDVTPALLHYGEAAITYIVPVPLLLVISRLIPPSGGARSRSLLMASRCSRWSRWPPTACSIAPTRRGSSTT